MSVISFFKKAATSLVADFRTIEAHSKILGTTLKVAGFALAGETLVTVLEAANGSRLPAAASAVMLVAIAAVARGALSAAASHIRIRSLGERTETPHP
jgi:hypothetical protein